MSKATLTLHPIRGYRRAETLFLLFRMSFGIRSIYMKTPRLNELQEALSIRKQIQSDRLLHLIYNRHPRLKARSVIGYVRQIDYALHGIADRKAGCGHRARAAMSGHEKRFDRSNCCISGLRTDRSLARAGWLWN